MTNKVGETIIKQIHEASCHCGSIVLSIYLPNGLVDLGRCNCSMCRRKGFISAAVPIDNIEVCKGESLLKTYQFNTQTAKHYFCSVCGIHTHHQRRSNPKLASINVACLQGVNPFELSDVPTGDGINHSSDQN